MTSSPWRWNGPSCSLAGLRRAPESVGRVADDRAQGASRQDDLGVVVPALGIGGRGGDGEAEREAGRQAEQDAERKGAQLRLEVAGREAGEQPLDRRAEDDRHHHRSDPGIHERAEAVDKTERRPEDEPEQGFGHPRSSLRPMRCSPRHSTLTHPAAGVYDNLGTVSCGPPRLDAGDPAGLLSRDSMRHRFLTADVFTERMFGGNQLAVFPDGRGIAAERMQQVAREFNFSETVFVLPPDSPAHTRRLRIFTPQEEIPFAGHPTIGTAFVLASIGDIPLAGDWTRIVFEEGAGPVPVRIRSRD